MSNDNIETSDVNSADAPESSSASESMAAKALSMSEIKDSKGVSLENRFSELSRKAAKIAEMEDKLNQVLSFVVNNKPSQGANPGTHISYDVEDDDLPVEAKVERLVEKKFREKTLGQLQKEHLKQFEEMKKVFPELDKDSDSYDPEFYRTADSIYQKNYLEDPEGAIQAIEIAAAKTGRLKRLAERAVLQDEARRSRKLSEGGSEARSKKTDATEDPNTAKALAKFGINPKMYKKAKQSLGNQ